MRPSSLLTDAVVDFGLLRDRTLRRAIRKLLAARLRHEEQRSEEERAELLAEMRRGVIALQPSSANRQHYDVTPRFFELVLGPRMKYSGCLWPPGVDSLAEAETEMLVATAARAGIEDGQRILDLGCGWGALSLFLAETFPNSQILAVTNSRAQRRHVVARAKAAGLEGRITVRGRDVNAIGEWPEAGYFERVVSVEMFEHARNYEHLFAGAARLLAPGGRLFVHVFAHRRFAYFFEDQGSGDWMARHFFSGGTMPSHELFEEFAAPAGLRLFDRAWIDGRHYARTCEEWLANLDQHRLLAEQALSGVVGGMHRAVRWRNRWRLFFMACAELFATADGSEWGVSHQVYERSF